MNSPFNAMSSALQGDEFTDLGLGSGQKDFANNFFDSEDLRSKAKTIFEFASENNFQIDKFDVRRISDLVEQGQNKKNRRRCMSELAGIHGTIAEKVLDSFKKGLTPKKVSISEEPPLILNPEPGKVEVELSNEDSKVDYKGALEVPKRKTAHDYRLSWVDSDDNSDEEISGILSCHLIDAGEKASMTISLPSDLESVCKYGFDRVTAALKKYKIAYNLTGPSFISSGFVGKLALSKDKEESRLAFSTLNTDQQKGLNMLKALMLLTEIDPLVAAQSYKEFVAAASFILGRVVCERNKDTPDIEKCLKYEEKGSKEFRIKVSTLFMQRSEIVNDLLNCFDKLYNAKAREWNKVHESLDDKLTEILSEFLFTSPAGIAERYFLLVPKAVNVETLEVSAKGGKTKTVKKKEVQMRKSPPQLHISDDLLSSGEKLILKELESRFNISELVRKSCFAKDAEGKRLHQIEMFPSVVKSCVTKAYNVTKFIKDKIKERRRLIRERIEQAGEIVNQSNWTLAKNRLFEEGLTFSNADLHILTQFVESIGSE